MAQAEWKKYFSFDRKNLVFYGLEANKDKLPQSPEEEHALKDNTIFCVFTDSLGVCVWDCVQQRWY